MLSDQAFLYVEDDAFSREIMQVIMNVAMGVDRFIMFEDSTNFAERLKSLPVKPAVVLLDIQMKPHNGFEMLKILRADPDYQKAKVIALTASVMNEEVERLRLSGFDGAIAKPLSVFTFPNLLERITQGEAVWHIV
jgi:CheY-like chemotaxis protein